MYLGTKSTSDAQPFVDELQNRVVNEGVQLLRVVADILANEYDFVVSYLGTFLNSWNNNMPKKRINN